MSSPEGKASPHLEAVKKDLNDAYDLLVEQGRQKSIFAQRAINASLVIETAKMLQHERQYQQTLKDYLG
jgi:hypothetical protein